MKLAPGPFQKIVNGEKVIESRLYDEKRKLIKPGDHILFVDASNPHNIVRTKVQELYRYQTFEALFSALPLAHFGGDSKEGLLQEIRQFYSPDEENEFGVIGIRIEKE